MTIHKTILGNSIFYINRQRNGKLNYNKVNEKTNKTYNYKTALQYYKALRKLK